MTGLQHLALHRFCDCTAAEAEGGARQAQWLEYLMADKGGKGLLCHAGDNLGCQENSHTLVAKLRTRREQQWSTARAFNELCQGSVPLAQLLVFREHVRQTGGVGQQVLDGHTFPAVSSEFGEEPLHRVGKGDLPAIH
jgi:hypothetical protein